MQPGGVSKVEACAGGPRRSGRGVPPTPKFWQGSPSNILRPFTYTSTYCAWAGSGTERRELRWFAQST
eukprot:scaffold147347_cov18-Tisochrysis_lutea.AAC.1